MKHSESKRKWRALLLLDKLLLDNGLQMFYCPSHGAFVWTPNLESLRAQLNLYHIWHIYKRQTSYLCTGANYLMTSD